MRLRISESDSLVGYLELDAYSGMPGSVKKTVRLRDLIEGYSGADVYLDFDANEVLLGVEILDDDNEQDDSG